LASSPFWPKTYKYDAPEAEAIYDRMVELTNCDQATDTLASLKSADLQSLRNAVLVVDASHTYNTSSYTWAPVIDGIFLRDHLTDALAAGRINPDIVRGMYNSHEGEDFAPTFNGSSGFESSEASFKVWLRGFLPGFGNDLIQEVQKMYPPSGTTETLEYNSNFARAGLVCRDVLLACSTYWIAKVAEEFKTRGFVGEYTIPPATHASDVNYLRILVDELDIAVNV
jgi:carboxylesterase type B